MCIDCNIAKCASCAVDDEDDSMFCQTCIAGYRDVNGICWSNDLNCRVYDFETNLCSECNNNFIYDSDL